MASAAIASKVTRASATSTMVCPCSRRCDGEISLGLLITSSVHVGHNRVSRNLSDSRVAGARRHELNHAIEVPTIGIAEADAGADQVEGVPEIENSHHKNH